jgi:heme oxygenase
MAGSAERATRAAPFALRVVSRSQGLAAIVYRRRVNEHMQERFDRVAALSPLALTAAAGLLRAAVRAAGGPARLQPGPFQPLDADWGARVAGFALVARGLRDARRLSKSAEHFRAADPAEAAAWFGRMQDGRGRRWVRALRIITEAVA